MINKNVVQVIALNIILQVQVHATYLDEEIMRYKFTPQLPGVKVTVVSSSYD